MSSAPSSRAVPVGGPDLDADVSDAWQLAGFRRSLTAAADHTVTAYLSDAHAFAAWTEGGGGTGTANIKSHHNVGGLPDALEFARVEPLRARLKDEVGRTEIVFASDSDQRE